jgi:hypothetical protein
LPYGLVLAGQEMSLVMLGWASWASEALDDVTLTSVAPIEGAGSTVCIAVDEMRATS